MKLGAALTAVIAVACAALMAFEAGAAGIYVLILVPLAAILITLIWIAVFVAWLFRRVSTCGRVGGRTANLS